MARLPAVLVAVLAVLLASSPSSARRVDGAAEFTFYPQAGIVWRDLYPNNFVDLDPGPGVRDYACGSQTYDGHTGIDTDVRSFREMDIGVPVFAALDGRVISVQDGEYDRNFGATTARLDNHVVVEHATGRFTIYGHLRKGIKLKRNDRVVAGQQLGWTASSGNSSWPHLHFTSQVAGELHEPFAGACNRSPSGWVEQVPLPAEAYLKDFALSTKPMSGRRDLPYDRAVRTGTFVRGTSVFYSRVEIGAIPPPGSGQLRMQILQPSGAPAGELTMTLVGRHGRGHWWFAHRVRLGTLGRWRVVVEFDGKTLADVPLEVVARKGLVRNRAPSPVEVSLRPDVPTPRGVVECRVATSLALEDPDLDIVRYRYRWTIDGRLVRAVQSAALSDVLRKGLAASGKRVECTVTPGDGRLSGPTATVAATSR
jgi:hypothetical protein